KANGRRWACPPTSSKPLGSRLWMRSSTSSSKTNPTPSRCYHGVTTLLKENSYGESWIVRSSGSKTRQGSGTGETFERCPPARPGRDGDNGVVCGALRAFDVRYLRRFS